MCSSQQPKEVKPKCKSPDEWINNIWYIHTTKSKVVLIHASTWMNTENIMLNILNQIQKGKYCVIPLV